MKFKRILSGILLTSMLTNGLLATAVNIGYEHELNIGEGTYYTDANGTNSSGNQNIRYVEYTPNSNISPIIAYGENLYGKSTITSVAEYVEGDGFSKEVIAGINADYYVTSSGIPIGLVINDGELISSDAWQQAVGFKADGSAVIGRPTLAMSISDATNYVTVDYYNKTRTTSGIYLLDSNFASETKFSQNGTNIILEKTTDDPITVGTNTTLRIVDIYETSSSTPILDNQMVLTVSESGPTERMPEFTIGSEVTLKISPSSEEWHDVLYAVGGQELLIDNGTVNYHGTSANPRTAIGVKADGTVVLFEVDGRGAGGSAGLSLNDLAAYLKSLGCVNAINLDGGGSSVIATQLPGDSTLSVMNEPSDGALRSGANFIFLINNTESTGQISNLHIYPETYVALPHGEIDLTVKATDENFYPVSAPSDIVYSVSEGTGTVTSEGVFTATEPGATTVIAEGDGVSGSEKLMVISTVSKINIIDSNFKPVSSLSLSANETIDLSAYSTYMNKDVASADNSYEWTVTGDIGTIDENGFFIASSIPATGKIVASYGGISASVSVSIGMGESSEIEILEDFEHTNIVVDSDITNEYSEVLYGSGSGEISYENSARVELFVNDTEIPTSHKAINLYVSSDNISNVIANFTDENGQDFTLLLENQGKKDDYSNYSASFEQEGLILNSFTFELLNEDSGKIFIDNIYTSETPIFDVTAPRISSNSSSVTIEEGQSANLSFNVTDDNGNYVLPAENIAMSLDGDRISNYSYDVSNGNINVTLSNLTQGIHRLTIDVSDNSSNLSTYSVDITVTSEEMSSLFVDTSSNWSETYANFVATQGIIKGAEENGELHFYPSRFLTRGEFAVIMSRFLNLETDPSIDMDLEDISSIPSWALDGVNAVYSNGIMTGSVDSGTGDVYFNASSNITRAEVMTVIGRTLEKGYDISPLMVSDISSIPSWSFAYVEALVSLNVVGGYSDGTIKPLNNITRGEIAKILYTLH